MLKNNDLAAIPPMFVLDPTGLASVNEIFLSNIENPQNGD